jgi:hypothetical protein
MAQVKEHLTSKQKPLIKTQGLLSPYKKKKKKKKKTEPKVYEKPKQICTK